MVFPQLHSVRGSAMVRRILFVSMLALGITGTANGQIYNQGLFRIDAFGDGLADLQVGSSRGAVPSGASATDFTTVDSNAMTVGNDDDLVIGNASANVSFDDFICRGYGTARSEAVGQIGVGGFAGGVSSLFTGEAEKRPGEIQQAGLCGYSSDAFGDADYGVTQNPSYSAPTSMVARVGMWAVAGESVVGDAANMGGVLRIVVRNVTQEVQTSFVAQYSPSVGWEYVATAPNGSEVTGGGTALNEYFYAELPVAVGDIIRVSTDAGISGGTINTLEHNKITCSGTVTAAFDVLAQQ